MAGVRRAAPAIQAPLTLPLPHPYPPTHTPAPTQNPNAHAHVNPGPDPDADAGTPFLLHKPPVLDCAEAAVHVQIDAVAHSRHNVDEALWRRPCEPQIVQERTHALNSLRRLSRQHG